MRARRKIVLMALVAALMFVACAGGDDSAPEPQTADPEVTETESASPTTASAKLCDPAPFAPTYLPWYRSGSLPEPEIYENGKDAILVWFGTAPEDDSDASVHADLSTTYKNRAPDSGTTMRVRGEEGTLTWNPKFSEMALRWTERDEPCGYYGLFLTDTTQSRTWHEEEIAKIAESLE